METSLAATRDVLLRRSGLMFVEPGGAAVSDNELRAVELELAQLGYVVSCGFARVDGSNYSACPVCEHHVDLPAGSTCYALFRERVIGPIAASDLLS